MPRPLRVDEDGNVVFLDEERNAATPGGREKPGKLARSGIMDWDELDRKLDEERTAAGFMGIERPIQLAETGNLDWNGYQALRAQGRRDGRLLRGVADSYTAPDKQGAVVGSVARTARVLDKNARVREKYVADVAKLDPFDNSGRSALKEHWRRPMPPETRVFVKAFRSGTGPQEGSSGRANITNPKVNQAVRTAGRLGRASAWPVPLWRRVTLRRRMIHGG